MADADLTSLYTGYIDCLNRQDWVSLGAFVAEDAEHNGRRLGLSGYRTMLENDFRQIPDLKFVVNLLLADPPRIAARLQFDCTPVGTFLGLAVNGRKVSFSENVIYEFRDGKIRHVWSVVDKAAIEGQLDDQPA